MSKEKKELLLARIDSFVGKAALLLGVVASLVSIASVSWLPSGKAQSFWIATRFLLPELLLASVVLFVASKYGKEIRRLLQSRYNLGFKDLVFLLFLGAMSLHLARMSWELEHRRAILLKLEIGPGSILRFAQDSKYEDAASRCKYIASLGSWPYYETQIRLAEQRFKSLAIIAGDYSERFVASVSGANSFLDLERALWGTVIDPGNSMYTKKIRQLERLWAKGIRDLSDDLELSDSRAQLDFGRYLKSTEELFYSSGSRNLLPYERKRLEQLKNELAAEELIEILSRNHWVRAWFGSINSRRPKETLTPDS